MNNIILVASSILLGALVCLVPDDVYCVDPTIRVPLTRLSRTVGDKLATEELYVSAITVGSKTIHVLFDTNSTDTIITHKAYVASKHSKTFNVGRPLEYRRLRLEGKRYTDIIQFGKKGESSSGSSARQATVTTNFMVLTEESDKIFEGRIGPTLEGIVGLAPRKVSSNGVRGFLHALYEDRLIKKRQFAIYLNPGLDCIDCGEIILGGEDEAKRCGAYIQFQNMGIEQWQLGATDFFLKDKKLPNDIYKRHADYRLTMDTGTSIMFGPVEDVAAIYKIAGANSDHRKLRNSVGCSQIGKLPAMYFHVENRAGLYLREYIESYNDGKFVCYMSVTFNSVIREDPTSNEWVLGSKFLSQYYTLFDWDKNLIGFAERTSGCWI